MLPAPIVAPPPPGFRPPMAVRRGGGFGDLGYLDDAVNAVVGLIASAGKAVWDGAWWVNETLGYYATEAGRALPDSVVRTMRDPRFWIQVGIAVGGCIATSGSACIALAVNAAKDFAVNWAEEKLEEAQRELERRGENLDGASRQIQAAARREVRRMLTTLEGVGPELVSALQRRFEDFLYEARPGRLSDVQAGFVAAALALIPGVNNRIIYDHSQVVRRTEANVDEMLPLAARNPEGRRIYLEAYAAEYVEKLKSYLLCRKLNAGGHFNLACEEPHWPAHASARRTVNHRLGLREPTLRELLQGLIETETARPYTPDRTVTAVRPRDPLRHSRDARMVRGSDMQDARSRFLYEAGGHEAGGRRGVVTSGGLLPGKGGMLVGGGQAGPGDGGAAPPAEDAPPSDTPPPGQDAPPSDTSPAEKAPKKGWSTGAKVAAGAGVVGVVALTVYALRRRRGRGRRRR